MRKLHSCASQFSQRAGTRRTSGLTCAIKHNHRDRAKILSTHDKVKDRQTEMLTARQQLRAADMGQHFELWQGDSQQEINKALFARKKLSLHR